MTLAVKHLQKSQKVKQYISRFRENSHFADFMSSLSCFWDRRNVNKTYPKSKFNVRHVSLCGFSVLALLPKLWSIKHKGMRPRKMGTSLLNFTQPCPQSLLVSNMALAWGLGSELNEVQCVRAYTIHNLLWWKESNLSPQISALASMFWQLQWQKVSYLYKTFKLVKSDL